MCMIIAINFCFIFQLLQFLNARYRYYTGEIYVNVLCQFVARMNILSSCVHVHVAILQERAITLYLCFAQFLFM